MSENQSRLERDLYDHEHDETRSSGARRRRPVADWGVGDDVFDHMPRNRFSRAAEGPPRERRFASRTEAAERHPGREDAGEPEAEAPRGREDAAQPEAEAPRGHERAAQPEAEAPRGRERAAQPDAEAPRGRERAAQPEAELPRGRVADGRRTIVIGRPEDVPSEIAALTADRDLGDDAPRVEPAPRAAIEAPVPPAAPGARRTIRIGGRPEGSLEATRAQRRRPPRTAHERVGPRPDRVAAWAVALGVLLILIAVLTAL